MPWGSCTTARRLVVHEDVHDHLVQRLQHAYRSIKIGPPLDDGTLLGPLIGGHAYEAMQAALAETANLTILAAAAEDLLIENGRIAGVVTAGTRLEQDLGKPIQTGAQGFRAAVDPGHPKVVGPHRDDWKLTIDGLDARTQASQGEQRSLALALRLAGRGRGNVGDALGAFGLGPAADRRAGVGRRADRP